MKGRRFMLLVIFLNIFCCLVNFIQGNVDAGLGWMVAVIWSVRSDMLEIRMKRMEEEKGKGDEDRDDGLNGLSC